MGARWFRSAQFSIRSLGLFTIGSAAVLSCFAVSGAASVPMAGLLWLAAISLAGVLDGRSGAGPIVAGVLSGALAGTLFSVVGMTAAWGGLTQLLWPGPGIAFYAYWWVATGALLGGLLGCLVRHRPARLSAPSSNGSRAPALFRHSSSWLASVHLHVIAGTVLSLTAVGLRGHLPASGPFDAAFGDVQPLICAFGPGEPSGENDARLTLDLAGDPLQELDEANQPGEVLDEVLEEPGSQDRILQHVRMLLNDLERTEAKKWLMSQGMGARPILEQIYQQASAATREQLHEVLGSFAGQGGSAGLRLTLVADKTTIKPGETVNFTTIVRNLNDRAINFYLGYSLSGVSFQTGAAFVVQDGLGASQLPVYAQSRGLCGTGAGPIYVVIAPGATASFHTPVTLGPVTTATFSATGVTYSKPVEAYGFARLHFPTGGGDVHRFSIRHQVEAKQHESHSLTRHGDFHPAATLWQGQAASNEVVLRIVR